MKELNLLCKCGHSKRSHALTLIKMHLPCVYKKCGHKVRLIKRAKNNICSCTKYTPNTLGIVENNP